MALPKGLQPVLVGQPGLDHGQEMPQVPEPETLPTTADLIGHIDDPVAQHWARERPVDVRVPIDRGIAGEVARMDAPGLRLPQMGWNGLDFAPGAHRVGFAILAVFDADRAAVIGLEHGHGVLSLR